MKETELKQKTDKTIDDLSKLDESAEEKVNGGSFICPAMMNLVGNQVTESLETNNACANYTCKSMPK